MIVNFMIFLLTLGFIGSSLYVLKQENTNNFGVIVEDESGKALLNGKQGTDVTCGRLPDNDIIVPAADISRKHLNLEYDGEGITPSECFIDNFKNNGNTISISNKQFLFKLPKKHKEISFKYLPIYFAVAFTFINCITIAIQFGKADLLISFGILVLYQTVTALTSSITSSILCCSATMLFTFYYYSTLYVNEDKKCLYGTIIFILSSIFVRLLFTYVPLTKTINPRLPKHYAKKVTVNDTMVFVCIILIIMLIAFNFFAGKTQNGATNWAGFGSFRFQPSAIIMPLFIVVLALPIHRNTTDILSIVKHIHP